MPMNSEDKCPSLRIKPYVNSINSCIDELKCDYTFNTCNKKKLCEMFPSLEGQNEG